MKKSEQISKSILLSQLKKDSHFEKLNLNDAFWEACTSGFIVYEKDAKVIYQLIYALELNNAEIVFKKLSALHNQFIKELAEMHVLGLKEEAIEKLIDNKSSEFAAQVQYFQTVKGVITKLERERIKKELPIAYEKATFEIPENDLEAVVKKTERENLKKKFKQWDEEIEAEEPWQTVPSEKKKPNHEKVKVIRLDWVKYAGVAAMLLISFLIWQPTKLSNDNLFAAYTTDELIVQSIDEQKIKVQSESGDIRGGEILIDNLNKSETELAFEAIELFKNNNYEKSKQILFDLKPKGRNNQLFLFLAVSQLKTNELSSAISNLEELNKISNFEFESEVKFYLALSYLKQNEKHKAKLLFNDIINGSNKYSDVSKEILSNIRWF